MMAFEFEALVGHLFVVGGRYISTTPPGALVEVAPKKAARGREADTIFILVLPTREASASTTFYEQMAQVAAERYFNTSGSVTAGLREVFTYLNQNLLDHNLKGKSAHEANIICAVVKGQDLIVGRIGSGVVAVLNAGSLQTFPEDLSDHTALYTEPLGVQSTANVRMTQFRVNSHTRILFADENLAAINRDQIANALMSADLGAALVAFKDLAKLQLTLMAAELVPPEAPAPHPVPEGTSTAEIAERARQESAKTRQTSETAATTGKKRRPRNDEAVKEVQRRTRRGLGGIALMIANWLGLLSKVLKHFFGASEEGEPSWITTPLGASSVVLLPIVVVMLVVTLWLGRAGESAIEICLDELNQFADNARSVVNNPRETVLRAWDLALTKATECNAIRAGEQSVADIRSEGQAVIDRLNDLTRLEARVLDSIPQAQLTRIISQGQNLLYTLDSANGLVYRISLSSDGLERSRPAAALPVRTGGIVDPGIEIGEIIDIGYNGNLVVVDRQGVVVECTINFNQCTAERLIDWERWVSPVAITIWSERIYILDTGVGRGQIWRYDKSAQGYDSGPIEYFGGPETSRPALTNGIDLEIDNDGKVYVLDADGSVRRWRSTEPEPFGFASFPEGQVLDNAISLFVDDRITSQSIYIVSRAKKTIYETSFIGTYNDSYSIFNDQNFDLLSTIAVEPGSTGTDLIYAASGNTIFVIQKG